MKTNISPLILTDMESVETEALQNNPLSVSALKQLGREIEADASSLRYLRVSNAVRSHRDQEDNDESVRRCILVVLALSVGIAAYALAWFLCGPVLWPFGGGR